MTDSRLAEIDVFLASKATRIIRTRKGRVWEVEIEGRPIDVHVENTADVLWDCEELLSAGPLPEDAPYRVVLAAGVNDSRNYEVLRNLATELSAILGGPFTEPTK